MMMNKDIEKRQYIIKGENLSIRATQDESGNKIIEGIAVPFGVESRLLAENGKVFNEIIDRGAFDAVLANEKLDAIYTFNHSRDIVLARTVNKTLTLNADEHGLNFRAVLNNTQAANDLYEMILRGDVFENSFMFTVTNEGQSWSISDGKRIRHIRTVNNLYDISTVTNAAYPSTEVYARGLDEFEAEVEKNTKEEQITEPDTYKSELERQQCHLHLLNIK